MCRDVFDEYNPLGLFVWKSIGIDLQFLYYGVFVDDHCFFEMSITSWNENELHSRYGLKMNPIVKGRNE